MNPVDSLMVAQANAYLARNEVEKEFTAQPDTDTDTLKIQWIKCGHWEIIPRKFLDLPMHIQEPMLVKEFVEKRCQPCADMKRLGNGMPTIYARMRK